MKKKGKVSIRIPVEPFTPKGHQPHRSGAGKHLDKRTRRARTRQAANRRAMEDS